MKNKELTQDEIVFRNSRCESPQGKAVMEYFNKDKVDKMKNNKFTPGPWAWFKGYLTQSNPDGTIPLNSKWITQATDFNNDADSALIAAAPELLEALEGLLQFAPITAGTDAPEEYIKALKAIEKAKGGAE